MAETHVVITGPIFQRFVLSSGKTVDTSPDHVVVDTPEEAAELAHLIGTHHATYGHPLLNAGETFPYVAPEGV